MSRGRHTSAICRCRRNLRVDGTVLLAPIHHKILRAGSQKGSNARGSGPQTMNPPNFIQKPLSVRGGWGPEVSWADWNKARKPRQIVFGRFSRGRGFGVGDRIGPLAGGRAAADCSSCHYYSALFPQRALLKLARQKPIKVLARLISAFLAGKRGISKREWREVWGIIYIIIEREQWGALQLRHRQTPPIFNAITTLGYNSIEINAFDIQPEPRQTARTIRTSTSTHPQTKTINMVYPFKYFSLTTLIFILILNNSNLKFLTIIIRIIHNTWQ